MKNKALIPLYILAILAIGIGGFNIVSIRKQAVVDDYLITAMQQTISALHQSCEVSVTLYNLIANLHDLEYKNAEDCCSGLKIIGGGVR